MSRQKSSVRQAAKGTGLDIDFQDVADGVEDELLVIDSEYRVRFANAAVLGNLEKNAGSPVGRFCFEVFHGRDKPCDVPLGDCPRKRVFETDSSTTFIRHIQISGLDRYIKITAAPLRDIHGITVAIVELRRDVTAEREVESQILRRHHQLRALSRISSDVTSTLDLESTLKNALHNVLEVVNGAIGGILLLDEETETLYYHVQHGLSARYAEEMRIPLGEGIAGRVAKNGEPILLEDISRDTRAVRLDLVTAEGLRGFISIPLKSKDRIIGVMNIASSTVGRFGKDDVSLLSSIGDYLGTAIEQAKLYKHLAREGERYHALLQHALSAQETERKRIARELHDETSQSLTSLTLSLQAIIGMAEMKGIQDTDLMERLKATHSYAVHAGNEIVKLMKELRPTLLDELGMPVAIHRYAKDTLQAHGINISAEFTGMEERLPPEVEVTLFRVAQGLIGNILEHSGARNVSIKLDRSTTECAMYIEDDGVGFDVSKITQVDPSGRGAGLFTLKERVRLVGGRCHIKSTPGKGTTITVKIPLPEGTAHEKHKSADSR